jgi:hypothetical protein
MNWQIDEDGKLVITITKKEQRHLNALQRRDEEGRCNPAFNSDDFLYDLLMPMFTDDSFTWLPEGTTGDMTSAPIIGVLGDEMPGPPTDKAECSGLYHCGRWEVDGELREIYQPVLSRWAFMDYALSSPQQELAETGRCEWDGGDYWGTQEAAQKAVAEFEARETGSAAKSEA